MVSQRI